MARNWCTRDWICGIGLKSEELRNLDRVEAEYVGEGDKVYGECEEILRKVLYLASFMVLTFLGDSSGRFFFTDLSGFLSRVAKL